MEEKLNELLRELGTAINEALSDSDRIADAIGKITLAGYEPFMVMEATIGVSRSNEQQENHYLDPIERSPTPAAKLPSPIASTGKIKLTEQDQELMKGFKISFGQEDT